MTHYDVLIVGGGIVGCTVARELTRFELKIALLDKECEVGFGTSKANSGIIHAGHHSDPKTMKGRLEWAGNQMWDQLCADLGFGFRRCGELTVAHEDSQRQTLAKLLRQGREKGVPGLEVWEPAQIRRAEPNLSPKIRAALHAPTTGIINPYEACFGLIDNACQNGLRLMLNSVVTALERDDDLWTVHTPTGLCRTRFVINAAGLYADRIAAMAGVGSFKVLPRKGEEYLLDKRLVGLVQRVIFPCPTPVSKGILVIPTYDGTIMVGPTAEETQDREDLSTSMEGGARVFAAVTRVVPGISERDCIAEFTGLRAVSDTNDFVIGPTSQPGFINVAGIQSPGLTAAPAIAELVRDMLQDEGLPLRWKDDFLPRCPQPIHFAKLSSAEQHTLVERDRTYARIACRCEEVTEGEVLAAIDRGARTLDGIKFRTRAGMGRCQGGFCTPRCLQLLSRKLEVPLTALTKRGGNSWMVCRREEAGDP